MVTCPDLTRNEVSTTQYHGGNTCSLKAFDKHVGVGLVRTASALLCESVRGGFTKGGQRKGDGEGLRVNTQGNKGGTDFAELGTFQHAINHRGMILRMEIFPRPCISAIAGRLVRGLQSEDWGRRNQEGGKRREGKGKERGDGPPPRA